MLAVAIAIIVGPAVVSAGWPLWLLGGWLFFGRRRRPLYAVRYVRGVHAYGSLYTVAEIGEAVVIFLNEASDHPHVQLREGDTVVFSATPIPGTSAL